MKKSRKKFHKYFQFPIICIIFVYQIKNNMYSLELLRTERDKLQDEFNVAINADPKNWDVICRNEILLEDLNKAIDLLSSI